jgi:hypothetical protein
MRKIRALADVKINSPSTEEKRNPRKSTDQLLPAFGKIRNTSVSTIITPNHIDDSVVEKIRVAVRIRPPLAKEIGKEIIV